MQCDNESIEYAEKLTGIQFHLLPQETIAERAPNLQGGPKNLAQLFCTP